MDNVVVRSLSSARAAWPPCVDTPRPRNGRHGFATHAAYMVGPNRSDADDPSWRGELYPLPQTTVIFGLRFDRLVGAVGRRAATPAK